MRKKRVLFIGNRSKVLESLLTMSGMKTVAILAQKDSYLERFLISSSLQYDVISARDCDVAFLKIRQTEFDILISNGCPLILPISRLKRPSQLYINIHPSLLPNLKGKHPINGALLKRFARTGATMHYMDDGVDTGNIICQEKLELTDDIDLDLLYHLLFNLEAIVFEKGINLLQENGYDYPGEPQSDIESYYSRNKEDMIIDFTTMLCDEILARVRAFGIKSQGTQCLIDGRTCQVYQASRITNPYLHRIYSEHVAGTVLLRYSNKFIVKAIDGIIKIEDYLEL